MSYADFVKADMRLTVLKLLEQQNCYKLNEYVLHSALKQSAHAVSREQLRAELSWLESQGLVRVENFEGITIVELTERGLDVAQGSAAVPGVKRPAPGK